MNRVFSVNSGFFRPPQEVFFRLIVFGVLVIIGGHPVIRRAGGDNRIIVRKELDYEKR